MVDDVVADGVVLVHHVGDHELGADAVDAGDHDGVLPAGEVNLEEAAEAADGGEGLGSPGRRDLALDLLEEGGGEVDVDARLLVGPAFAFEIVGHDGDGLLCPVGGCGWLDGVD